MNKMPDDDSEDDEDFRFPYAPSKSSKQHLRQAVEHDETQVAEQYYQSIVNGAAPHQILNPVREVHKNNLRKLGQHMGKVEYGDNYLLWIFSDYWNGISANSKKNRNCTMMAVESEGVLTNKALLNRNHQYHYPVHYNRLTASYHQNVLASTESIKAVGIGQFGKVFQAIDRVTEQRFAEKIVTLDQFSKNELEVLGEVDHRHIIKFFGAIRSSNGIHIFLHYAEGGSIQQLLQNNGGLSGHDGSVNHLFSELWAVTYYSQVLSALVYLHSKNIVHCDIKPSNIVLSRNLCNCYLTDFGEVLKIPQGKDYIDLNNTTIGTPNYMCPEVIDPGRYHYGCDVWSAACFLLQMLTTEVPWTMVHPGLGTYLLAITKRPFGILKEIPDWVQNLTRSMLHSSFTEIGERKSAKELLKLAEKNLDLLKKMYSSSVSNSLSYPDESEFNSNSCSAELAASNHVNGGMNATANNEELDEPGPSAVLAFRGRFDDDISSSVSPRSKSPSDCSIGPRNPCDLNGIEDETVDSVDSNHSGEAVPVTCNGNLSIVDVATEEVNKKLERVSLEDAKDLDEEAAARELCMYLKKYEKELANMSCDCALGDCVEREDVQK